MRKVIEYICDQGKELSAVAAKKRKTGAGYQKEVTVYECADCKDCPVQDKCIMRTAKALLEGRRNG